MSPDAIAQDLWIPLNRKSDGGVGMGWADSVQVRTGGNGGSGALRGGGGGGGGFYGGGGGSAGDSALGAGGGSAFIHDSYLNAAKCLVSAWGDFGECTEKCNSGLMTRYRTVERDATEGGLGCSR